MTIEEQKEIIDRMNKMSIVLGFAWGLNNQLLDALLNPDMCVSEMLKERQEEFTRQIEKLFYGTDENDN